MNLSSKFYMPFHFPFRKELAAILILILFFLLFPFLIRHADITAAAIDPGIFSAVILAISAVLIFKAITWWLMKTIWPVFAEYSNAHFERNFKSLYSWQKVVIYLIFYLFIFYSFIAVLGAFI